VQPAAHIRLPAALLAIVVSMLAAGCGSGRQTGAAGELVPVKEADFKISATRSVAAGDVNFRVHNGGPDEHELIIVRWPSSRLPLRTEGVTADEDKLEKAEAGSLEPGEPGATRELRVHLAPGRYVLFCNMAGHYLGGMHETLVVN
jgi:uncharacterized cupredoxin-like copper-binding protein